MKKLLSLTSAVLLLLSGLFAETTVDFKMYRLKWRESGASVHQYSAAATTFNQFNEDDNLSQLWLPGNGSTTPQQLPTIAEIGTPDPQLFKGVALPFDVEFSGMTAHYVGITGGGDIYFAEKDSIYAAINPEIRFAEEAGPTRNIRNLLLFRGFGTIGDYAFNLEIRNTERLKAAENCSIQFEKDDSGDTLWVTYNNVYINDGAGRNPLVFSFQYTICKDGNITWQPLTTLMVEGGDRTTGVKCYGYTVGVYGEGFNDGAFFANAGHDYSAYGNHEKLSYPTKWGQRQWREIGAKTYPKAGESFTFTRPGNCEKVSNPVIANWGVREGNNYIQFNYNKDGKLDFFSVDKDNPASKVLLILSENAQLTGTDLPVDGVEYNKTSTIGTSKAVALVTVKAYREIYGGATFDYDDAGKNDYSSYFIEGLDACSKYYLHALPYDHFCVGGPLYNTDEGKVLVKELNTYADPVKSISVDQSKIEKTSLTLNIENGGKPYMLAALPFQVSTLYSRILVEPKQYTDGETFTYRFMQRPTMGGASYKERILPFKVIKGYSTEATVDLPGLESGTEYFFYVWNVEKKGEEYIYSADFKTCAGATQYEEPAYMHFNNAAMPDFDGDKDMVYMTPAGWEINTDFAKRPVYIRESEYGNILGQMYYVTDENTEVENTVTSPILAQGGEKDSAHSVIARFYYWGETQMVDGQAYGAPTNNDTIHIQYRPLSGGEWITAASVTGADAAKVKMGLLTFETGAFVCKEAYRLRFVFKTHNYPESGPNSAMPYVGLIDVTVEPVLPCKPVGNLDADMDNTTSDVMSVKWEDGNMEGSAGYMVSYRMNGEEEWSEENFVNLPFFKKGGLEEATLYQIKVRAICKSNDTSLVRTSEVKTYASLPYVLKPECGSYNCELPVGSYFHAGSLPATGNANLLNPTATLLTWQVLTDGDRKGLGMENMYSDAVVNPQWFMFPTLALGSSVGTVNIDVNLSAWSVDLTEGANSSIKNDPMFNAKDKMYVLASTDKTFSRANNLVGEISLRELEKENQKLSFEYDVTQPDTKLYIAVYTEFVMDNTSSAKFANSIWSDSIVVSWGKITCPQVTNVIQSGLSKTEVNVRWKGIGWGYALAYKETASQKWIDTLKTEGTDLTLRNLTPGTSYQYTIWSYCDSGYQTPGKPIAFRYFNTIKECITPRIDVIGVSWDYVRIAMGPKEQERIVQFWPDGYENQFDYYYDFNTEKDTVRVTEMYLFGREITFHIRCKAICSSTDSSDWSNVETFKLAPMPTCGKPTNLNAKVDNEWKRAMLTWKPGQNNLYGRVEYKLINSKMFDTLNGDQGRLSINVMMDTMYQWKVTGICDQYGVLVSGATAAYFSTGGGAAVENPAAFENLFKVSTPQNQIIIENPTDAYIKRVEVIARDGRIMRSYQAGGRGNLFLAHSLPQGVAVIRIIGENNRAASYKVVIM